MHPLLPFLCLGLTATAALAKTPTVLVLGDSLSAGYGLSRSEAYPALLSKKAE
ncbi:MAG: arylesterase, partial [Chthoniobacterales bacterium]